jgi:ABC-2 type transport system ATP-binding protein
MLRSAAVTPAARPEPANDEPGLAAIACDAVSRNLRGQQVLDRISFSLGPGQALAVVGVNGAGKTSLLRCLLDFGRPDSGTIRLFGRDSRDPAARRHLGYLPERFQAPSHLTGHETLAWFAGLLGTRWMRARSDVLAQRFQLPDGALDRRVSAYSKGMMQKLALAALIASDRPLLVLDEPMSGLDPLARRNLQQLLAQVRGESRTLVMTSHSLADVEALADRLLLLHRGRALFFGPPAALVESTGAPDLEAAFVACVVSAGQGAEA